jgi:hypothetical protein
VWVLVIVVLFNFSYHRDLWGSIILISAPLVFLGLHSFTENNAIIVLLLFTMAAMSYYFRHSLLKTYQLLLVNPKFTNTSIIILLCIISPLLFRFGVKNESLKFIPIPVLHLQKFFILLFYYLTENKYFKENIWRVILRYGLIIGYSCVLSFISKDFSSLIFCLLAVALIEIVRKRLPVSLFCTLLLLFFGIVKYDLLPTGSFFSERKVYRLEAPVKLPVESELAYEGDRETVEGMLINLKTAFSKPILEAPLNSYRILPENKSTFFSDFSTHFSLLLGGYLFLMLYILVIFLILYHLLFLLFCSIRSCRVNSNTIFQFPQSRIAGSVQYLLAFTIIGFILPTMSNLLIGPLVGVSVPGLSISNIEVFVFALLVLFLETLFNTKAYYEKRTVKGYTISDLRKSVSFGLFLLAVGFGLLLTARVYMLVHMPDAISWKKSLRTNDTAHSLDYSTLNTKTNIVTAANNIIAKKDIVDLSVVEKAILLNLSAKFYSNKLYHQIVRENSEYKISTAKQQSRMLYDSLFTIRQLRIDGYVSPFGPVYGFFQQINGVSCYNITNPYYFGYVVNSTIDADFQAELNKALERHLQRIGISSNRGQVIIVDNSSGELVANCSFPFTNELNTNDFNYLIGSVKKAIIAFAALKIDPEYYHKSIAGYSFNYFLVHSQNDYAEGLLLDLLLNHKTEFEKILKEDFDLPLYSETINGFSDIPVTDRATVLRMSKRGDIRRLAIGMQQVFQFKEVVKWYARMAGLRKINLIIDKEQLTEVDSILIDPVAYSNLKTAMNGVITDGSAAVVGATLKNYHLSNDDFWGKTGTPENNTIENFSSSFLVSNKAYTFGVTLIGKIPNNSRHLSAKDLFNDIIPLLLKYKLVVVEPSKR